MTQPGTGKDGETTARGGPSTLPADPRRGETPAENHEEVPRVPCDVCGGPTYEARCKVICRRCGYTRDCSDP